MLLIALSGCQPTQTDYTPHDSETTPAPDVTTNYDTSQNDNTESTDAPSDPNNSNEPLFKYDKYMVAADTRNYMSEREYFLYCKMIDSILAHDGVVSGFESYEEFNRVRLFLCSEFIPVGKIIQHYGVSNEPFLYEDGTATFKFIGDKETCSRNYAMFENIMNEALSLIKEDDNDWERIAKLYLYVSEHMTYGSPYELYNIEADFYNSIVYKVGMCTQYAEFLNMLANQIGFETIDAHSLGKSGFGGADHAWSMIRVDGQWYHFDACWQSTVFQKDYMEYFALNTKDRYNSLATNNAWGMVEEIEMYDQHDHTSERSELPYCENGMNSDDRLLLYYSIIDEYREDLSRDIPKDMIDDYIDSIISEVQEFIDNGKAVGIRLELQPQILNGHVKDLITKYSPKDLQNYPQLENDGAWCRLAFIALNHIDQSNLRPILYSIIQEAIVVDQSVKLLVL